MNYFSSKTHRNRVFECMINNEKVYANERLNDDYLVAYYLLLSNNLYSRTNKYINKKEQNCSSKIDFDSMLNSNGFSRGERLMVEVAYNLFNHKTIDLDYYRLFLDRNNYKLVCNAVKMTKQMNFKNVFIMKTDFKSKELIR